MLLKNRVLYSLLSVFILWGCSSNAPKKIVPLKNVKTPITVIKKLPKIDHIVIVMEENHSQKAIKGNPSAAYINALMNQGANLTNYHAMEHPSQPNYLDLFSGSNQGVTSDRMPGTKFSSSNLASELIAKGYTFAGFSEDLPQAGFNGESNGKYARKHNPWVNFTNVPQNANRPLDAFPSDYSKLPTVSFVIPNLNHDMHDGTIEEADQWLKQHLNSYVKWADKHNSLLIVTWDEDDNSQENKIATFLVGPMVKTGQFSGNWNHYNLLRTLEDLYGLSYAGQSIGVDPIIDIWK